MNSILPIFPETRTIATLSTAHMRKEDAERANGFMQGDVGFVNGDGDDGPDPLCGLHRLGYLFKAGRWSKKWYSKELVAILAAASNQGYGYVLFDRDGPCSEQFPTFEW